MRIWPLKYYIDPIMNVGPFSMFRNGLSFHLLIHTEGWEIVLRFPIPGAKLLVLR